ncbi:sirohydrochlorin chelatase [Lacisediminihabitans sp.]|uniref:sirohydrochlorin chelatase n=1 Tax=Lacisediminihabitans sp. TaxID=2787631 RepID=UPI002F931B62
MSAPVLLAASHGTSDPAGQAAVAALVRAVADARPDTAVRGSFVDVQQPSVPSTLDALADGVPAVVVPLLLSAGYHVHVDLADAAREALPRRVTVTGALGPDARITRVLADRLHEAGLADGDRIVLAAAGSSNADAVADCHTVGRELSILLGRPVTVAFISAAQPRLSCAVAGARISARGARVIVATYLLAPGYFAGLARTAGADMVTAPLLAAGEEPPEGLVETVIDLYERAAAGSLSALCDERVTAA